MFQPCEEPRRARTSAGELARRGRPAPNGLRPEGVRVGIPDDHEPPNFLLPLGIQIGAHGVELLPQLVDLLLLDVLHRCGGNDRVRYGLPHVVHRLVALRVASGPTASDTAGLHFLRDFMAIDLLQNSDP